MEKLIIIVEREPSITAKDFSGLMRSTCVAGLRGRDASDITIHLPELDGEVRQVAPHRIHGDAWHKIGGALGFWVDSLDGWREIEASLHAYCKSVSTYLVTESVVQKAERTWKDGERRPGVTQFNLAQRPAHVAPVDFYREWQEVHSPNSFELHPNRWSYVRNSLARVLTPGAIRWDIIVLEHFRYLEDFTDDARYVASAEMLEDAMTNELPRFADLETIIMGPMNEYHFY